MTDFTQLLHNELLRIADDLIQSACEDEHGVYWKTLHRQPYGEVYEQVNEEMYNGVSGISLFFISLYQYTHNGQYLQIAQKSLDWSVHYLATTPEKYYTFYTGGLGVVYALIKLYEATSAPSHLNRATQLLHQLKDGIRDEVKIDDLLSGNAGNLFVVAYLYTYTRNSEQAAIIRLLVSRLIRQARISRTGIKWGYFPNAIDSLLGMSHGAAGIAHVLVEVAHALRYPALHWVAGQALRFEDEYYSKRLRSWIDMRIYPQHRGNEAVMAQGFHFYQQHKSDVNAWAHGTAGMGLARINAFNRNGRNVYKKAALQAVRLTLKDSYAIKEIPNFTISVGVGSWVELLLTAAATLHQPKLRKHAENLVKKAIHFRFQKGFYGSAWFADKPDPSLLLGTAGIGYIYLRFLGEQTNSVLIPAIPSSPVAFTGKMSLLKVKQVVYGKHLQRTLAVLQKCAVDTGSIWRDAGTENIQDVCKKVKAVAASVQKEQRPVVADICKLEIKRIEMLVNPDYNLYREQQSDFFKAQLSRLDTLTLHGYEQASFKKSKHAQVIRTKWHWPLDKPGTWAKNITAHLDAFYTVLRLEIKGIEEIETNVFCGFILESLTQQRSFGELLQLLKEAFVINDHHTLTVKLISQLRYLMEQWMIELKNKRTVGTARLIAYQPVISRNLIPETGLGRYTRLDVQGLFLQYGSDAFLHPIHRQSGGILQHQCWLQSCPLSVRQASAFFSDLLFLSV